MADKRPNILWISLEDTSPRFGCYGDTVAQTPNIDKLASDGCIYPNAFSTAGVCAPSRHAIITGMYQTSTGGHHMRTTTGNKHTPELPTPYDTVTPHFARCIPEYLRAAGYYCTNNSKTDYQFTAPFTAWDDCSNDGHWRNRKNPDQPFFAVFNPFFTHESGMWEEDNRPMVEAVTDPDDVSLPPYLPDTRKAREALARQYDNLHHGDGVVGEILKELEEDGLADNTIVILWSDHGEGLPRAKRWPYDQGINIPLIVRWPGQLDAGSKNEQLVSLIDLGPTILSLCGVKLPRHLQGQPFIGPEKQERDYIFATRDRYDESYDMIRAVRDKQYKYIRNYYPEKPYLLWLDYRNRHPIIQELYRLHEAGELTADQQIMLQESRPPEELYDTQADPWEMNNLAEDPAHADTLERMRQELADWQDRYGDYGFMDESQMVRQFYPDGKQPETAAVVPIPINQENVGQEPLQDGGTINGPFLLQLHCATQGASMGYRLNDESDWQLYTGPIRIVESGKIALKAIRIGYQESQETELNFTVT